MLKVVSILSLTLFLAGAIDGEIWLGCVECDSYFGQEIDCVRNNNCVVSNGEFNYNENSDACVNACYNISKQCRVACFAAHDQCKLRCGDEEECFVACYEVEMKANTKELGVIVP